MISFIIDLFVDVKRFGFYIKPSSEQSISDLISCELYFILLFEKKRKKWKTF